MNYRLFSSLVIGVTVLSLAGCASTSDDQTVANHKKSKSSVVISDQGLRNYYSRWSGVPYRYGGTTKSGIDCSAFIQRVYNERYHVSLPRMTVDQVTKGKKVTKKQLKTGDLVFFKTGRAQRHVGVYVGNNQFMHASTSRGVMVSNLDNSYWQKAYWQTRRILD